MQARAAAPILLLPICLVGPTTAAEPADVLLSDCETADHWRGVTVIDDAKVGAGAVRYEVPAGTPAGPTLDHRHLDLDFRRGGELRFWYRFTGRGTSSLMIKIVAYPFADGWQATWFVNERCEGDGQWRVGTVDLASEWMQWGQEPDRNSKVIYFRTQADKNAQLTLDIDQVEWSPRRFTVALGSCQVAGDRGTVELTVTNTTDEPLSVEVAGDASPQTIELPAGGRETVTAEVPLPVGWTDAPPLHTVNATIRVAPTGAPGRAKELLAMFTRPLELPAHPRLLVTDAELPGLREKIETVAWAKAIWEGQLKTANDWLEREVVLPDRGSQWWHYYACKQDGARLQTVSPTEHKCPVCGTVYSGWPYDDVVLDRQHGALSSAVRTLGLVYRVTGDPRYAAKAREIVLAYAARYRGYPLHNIRGEAKVGGGHVGPQTLDESTWLIPMTQGADLIWDALSDEDRAAAEEGLFRPAAQCILDHRMGIHNIQCWKNSAVGLVGLLLGDAALVSDAVKSDHGFEAQIAQGVSADGQWYEGAWGYHFYTMMALAPLLEAGERCGLGLWAFERDGRSARRLFEAPLDLAMPDLRLPAFNDSGTANVRGNALYELALARTGEARLAAPLVGVRRGSLEALLVGVEPLPEPPAEATTSRNFAAAGYAVLRHGADSNAAWACLKYGPHGGGHGHPDKLNLVLYAAGKIVGVDPGTAAYGVPIQREWFRTTIAHNTLTVDETDQREATGRSLAFGDDGAIGATLAAAGPIAEGVDYRRGVALFGQHLVLVIDLVRAEAEHTFDLAWHNAGAWESPPVGQPVTMPAKPGYQHLRDVVAVTGALPPVKVADDLSVGLAVGSVEPGETWVGTGVGANTNDRVPCVVRRVRGRTAVVGWAIALDGAVPEIELAEGGVTATVGGRRYRLAVSEAELIAEGPGGRLALPVAEGR